MKNGKKNNNNNKFMLLNSFDLASTIAQIEKKIKANRQNPNKKK